MARETDSKDALKLGIKFVGESLIPGGSNYLEGRLVTGGVHTVLGLLAKSLFGLPGLLVVSANSLSKSVTGHGLLEHVGMGRPSPEPAQGPSDPRAASPATRE
jgi:hypothetical protein